MISKLDLPRLSISERDLRWKKIRNEMSQRSIDCLVVSGESARTDSGNAHSRFLTSIGGNFEETYTVFPIDADPTCFTMMTSPWWWGRAQDWVTDIRRGRSEFPWADNIASRLKELKMEKGNIGVVGLGSTFPRPSTDGTIKYTTFDKLKSLLPETTFVDANDILERAQLTKSREVIEFHRKAALLGDASIEAMRESAKPGVKEYEVFASMIDAITSNGGEYPPYIIWEADKEPRHPGRLPTFRPLEVGDIIINEISPKYGGYWAHPQQPLCVASSPSSEYTKMFEVCVESLKSGLKKLVPGKSFKEVNDAFRNSIESEGFTLGIPPCQGLGLNQAEALGEQVLEGMVIGLQPFVANKEGTKGINVGETYAISSSGPEKLGTRKEIEFIVSR